MPVDLAGGPFKPSFWLERGYSRAQGCIPKSHTNEGCPIFPNALCGKVGDDKAEMQASVTSGGPVFRLLSVPLRMTLAPCLSNKQRDKGTHPSE